ncbi:MAG: DUF2797 domain-containing protein [Coxiellaceae bacterium]|nr:DUF2797 domain-containing protein [Coxiellaceae bacterium]
MVKGNLRKMHTDHQSVVQYTLPVGDELIPMNDLIGKTLTFTFDGVINCVHCNKKTNKSFNQGFCFPCFRKLAQCDRCIMSPELCHFAQGTCREPGWGETHCMIPHVIYLANSSCVKVGITRGTQVPTRWMDQGAIQALPIIQVDSRYHSGLIEVILKQHMADRTNWRKMLKNEVDPTNLKDFAKKILVTVEKDLNDLRQQGFDFTVLENPQDYSFEYPVLQYPTKVSSLSFDKKPEISGELQGIKGQYLIFDTGVLNIRKFGGYEVSVQY